MRLAYYQKRIEKLIDKHVSTLGSPSLLSEASAYALLSGGKRLRPSLVFMVAEGLGSHLDVSYAALAVECFHTASLVVDDLPSMDDDERRRHKPAVHARYGESVALLVSYALIASGYACVAKNATAVANESLCSIALENAAYNTGLHGATGGQFLDISPPDTTFSTLKEIIHKKTTSLFEIAFVFGWLFGGGNLAMLGAVKQAASHFGLAFQIADDLSDMTRDKKKGCLVNVANVLGVASAQKILREERSSFVSKITSLGLETSPFQELLRSG